MIVSERGTKASWPLAREGISLAGGSVDEVKTHGESTVDEVNTHGESTELEIPFVEARAESSRMVNMVPAQMSLLNGESYLCFF